MYNATNLLGTLMQHIATPSARGRVGEALTQEAGSSGPLGGLLSRLGGDQLGGGILGNLIGALGGGGRGAEGGGQNLMDLARQAIASPGQELASNNPVAVGGLGALVGKLVGGGRGAIGGGLLAVLGSLAYSALQAQGARGLASLGDQPSAMPAAAVSGGYGRPAVAALPTTELDMERMARLVLRSMIQAAKADNQIDASEIERITGKISEADGTEAAEARSAGNAGAGRYRWPGSRRALPTRSCRGLCSGAYGDQRRLGRRAGLPGTPRASLGSDTGYRGAPASVAWPPDRRVRDFKFAKRCAPA